MKAGIFALSQNHYGSRNSTAASVAQPRKRKNPPSPAYISKALISPAEKPNNSLALASLLDK
jgi:hypothetical protein